MALSFRSWGAAMTISAEYIARVRAFNRDYTRRIGVLSEGLLESPYSLTEVRVMYELAHREGVTAAELADDLDLDRGYLSRLLKGFEAKKLLARTASREDARRQHMRLTAAGKRVLEPLERRSQEQVRMMFGALDAERQRAVLSAMDIIQSAFDAERSEGSDVERGSGGTHAVSSRRPDNAADAQGDAGGPVEAIGERGSVEATAARGSVATSHARAVDRRKSPAESRQPFTVRTHRPGDMGWVVQRHGEIYHQEYGWNEEFEALVAEIAAEFVRKLDVARERCWIAERDGRRVGCIFLVAKDATIAKLRLLLVEPDARGIGLGRALVRECVRFAREAGYQKVVLWTQETLSAARHLYEEAGFRRTAQDPHHSFGHDLVAETWELDLRTAGDAAKAETAKSK
jgi:DNA-binding MarR family transcriptional regulator/GNAT superfamily N-acetyltransferase